MVDFHEAPVAHNVTYLSFWGVKDAVPPSEAWPFSLYSLNAQSKTKMARWLSAL
jgi:hypothetical protein